jgi:signal transduction histidine kinase
MPTTLEANTTHLSNTTFEDYIGIKQSYMDSLKDARVIKDYEKLARFYHKLADLESVYSRQKTSVVEYYNRAIEYYKLTEDDPSIRLAKLSIAKEFIKNGLIDNADDILEQIQEEYSILNDTTGLLKVYVLKGEIAIIENNVRLLEEYNTTTSQLISTKDSLLYPGILLKQAEAALLVNNPDEAISIINDNIDVFINEKEGEILLPEAEIILGKSHFEKKQWWIAIDHLTKAENQVKHLPLNKQYQNILLLKQDVYSANNQYDQAYHYAELESKLKDSLLNRVRFETISDLSEKYKSKEKSTEIKVLEIEKKYAHERNEQQRRTLYVLILVLLILSMLIYFTVRFYNNQMAANKIISSQNAQISQQKILTLEDEIKLKGMHSMIEGQESERERISKDLHDSLGGLLSTIKLQLDHIPIDETNTPALDKQHHMQDLIDLAVQEVRNISSNLQPVSLKNLGLIAAVSDLITRYRGDDSYPDIEFQHYDVPKSMDTMVALSVYRIIQELINNTIKHAQANEIHLQLRREDNVLILQYEDDGIGFDLESLKQKGMGLENITSRVDYLRGELSIDARIGGGVSYMIDINLDNTRRDHV